MNAITRVNNLTIDILRTHYYHLSFECCYRIMYQYQVAATNNDSTLLEAIQFFELQFYKGKWHSLLNWQALRDAWLYPIRMSSFGKLANVSFDRLISIIACYPVLTKKIYDQHNLPRDIRQLIDNYLKVVL